jgi:predicted aspartyl protease
MRFDYAAIIARAPDSGDYVVIFRPEVQVTLYGPNGSGEFRALVDTGADNIVFPGAVARDLGIPLTACKGPAATVFGGQEVALYAAEVELELVALGERLRWKTQAYFAVGAEEESLILGHQGFLEYFTATFKGDEFALDLEANPYLPT